MRIAKGSMKRKPLTTRIFKELPTIPMWAIKGKLSYPGPLVRDEECAPYQGQDATISAKSKLKAAALLPQDRTRRRPIQLVLAISPSSPHARGPLKELGTIYPYSIFVKGDLDSFENRAYTNL